MVRFLIELTHPDGEIALFNDSAFGIEAQPSDLIAYYENLSRETELGQISKLFRNSKGEI
jgi:hypothetical protein